MQAVIKYDLNALAHNLSLIRKIVAAHAPPGSPPVELQPVVKSCAYGLARDINNGLSMTRLLDTFVELGCRSFYIAHWQEIADYLSTHDRLALDLEFFALNGITDSRDAQGCIEFGITPVINNLSSLHIWHKATNGLDEQPPYALHVDTGMNRLGLSADEFSTFVASITDRENPLSRLNLPSWLISHLSCADDQTSSYNAEQLTRFRGHCAQLAKMSSATTRPFKISLANSAGCFLSNDYYFDAVRIGAALYGLCPVSRALADNKLAKLASGLRAVVHVSAPIVQLRAIDAGETVGYAQGWIARRKTLVAMVAFGYGDGYPFVAGTKNFDATNLETGDDSEDSMMALYKGKRLRVLGRVSMDLLALDFTDLGEQNLTEQQLTEQQLNEQQLNDLHLGGMVALLGEQITCEQLASHSGDLNYRVLTSMTSSQRARHEVLPLSQSAGRVL